MIKNLKAVFARIRDALRRRGTSVHDAEDLLQEAWLHMARREGGEPIADPEAFLMRVALNLSIDAERVRSNHGTEVDIEKIVLVDGRANPEEATLERERWRRVEQFLVWLGTESPRTRAIFVAHRVHGLEVQELARRYGISKSLVEKHLAKAMMLLHNWMDGC